MSPPGFEVTVYVAAPIAATQATVARPSPATAVTPVGADGIATNGITAPLDDEVAEPSALIAVTVNV